MSAQIFVGGLLRYVLTQTEEEKEKKNAKRKRVEDEVQALTMKSEVLTVQLRRTEQKRKVRHEPTHQNSTAVVLEFPGVDNKHVGDTFYESSPPKTA